MYSFQLIRRFSLKTVSLPADKRVTVEVMKELEARWHPEVLGAARPHVNIAPQSKKSYVLPMFPYPSGNLHMGHVRVYTISDCIARFQRMQGKEVIHPIGWDAFGLPAENAAIERGESAPEWTKKNISSMRSQLTALGCDFDWHRELETCDPAYYKWTQKIFLELYKAGLAYRRESFVNWDPIDGTVLAEEQIDANGRAWRSGAMTEKKALRQWFVRTTRFAEALLECLNGLLHWEEVAEIQQRWIGKIDCVKFHLKLKRASSKRVLDDELDLTVPLATDLPRVSFVALASTHVLNQPCYRTAPSASADGATGTGGPLRLDVVALHPLTGEELPIFVDDSFPFRKLAVYAGLAGDDRCVSFMAANGVHVSPQANSGTLSDADILERAQAAGCGGYRTSSKGLDWVVSRQRYWGTPIPMVYCEQCKTQPVPDAELPVELPQLPRITAARTGSSPLATATEWMRTKCPCCGGDAVRETDTLDTFFDSAWYFLRYLDNENRSCAFDARVNKLMPVDVYIGGKEHATLHLYYARFMCHFLASIGWTSSREPFHRLLMQGMVTGQTFRLEKSGEYVLPSRVVKHGQKALVDSVTKERVVESWEKMSKSKHNGVDPRAVLDTCGCDLTRLMITIDVAPEEQRNWSMEKLPGAQAWLSRVLSLVADYAAASGAGDKGGYADADREHWERTLHEYYNFFVRSATHHLAETFLLSTVLQLLNPGLTNVLRKAPPSVVKHSEEFERCLFALVVMLAPFVPHFAAEMWAVLSRANVKQPALWKLSANVFAQRWPALDADALFDFDIYVNDARYARLRIDRRKVEVLDAKEALRVALTDEKVLKALHGLPVLRQSFQQVPNYGAQLRLVRERTQDELSGKRDEKELRVAKKELRKRPRHFAHPLEVTAAPVAER